MLLVHCFIEINVFLVDKVSINAKMLSMLLHIFLLIKLTLSLIKEALASGKKALERGTDGAGPGIAGVP